TASAIAASAVTVWLFVAIRAAADRRRAQLIAIGHLLAIVGGGVAIAAYLLGWVDDLRLTAPALLVASALIGAAVLGGERGRGRRLVGQALVLGVITAALSAIALTLFYAALPALAPRPTWPWIAACVFLAALPLDAVRALVVEGIGRRLFARPIGVRDLA